MIEEMKLRVLMILFFSGFITVSNAQESQNFQWAQYYLTHSFSEKIVFNADGGPRWRSFFGETSQYILRMSVGRPLKNNWNASIGLAHLGHYSEGKAYRYEWRPYVEGATTVKSNKLTWKHRFRLEMRNYREPIGNDDPIIDTSCRWRPRYRLLTVWPLGTSKKWQITFGDELLIHFRWDNGISFNQNRVLIGPQHVISDRLTFSFLLNWQQTGIGENQYRNDYIFWLGLNHRI
jgi:hypothetical protein